MLLCERKFHSLLLIPLSQGSSVDVVTRLQAGQPRNRVSIVHSDKVFDLSQKVNTACGAYSSHNLWAWGLSFFFSGEKRPAREVARFTNEWSYLSETSAKCGIFQLSW